jgi:glycosyltransferase involved in cell wall biosynthesis
VRQVRIGINALLLSAEHSYRNAGVSYYTRTLLAALNRLDQAHDYQVYVSERAALSDLALANHITLHQVGWPARTPLGRIGWEQIISPAAMRRARLDLWHAPVHVLPLWLPCPGVVTLHDLAFLRFPAFFRPARRHYQTLLTRRSAERARLIIAVSEHTRRECIELLGIPEERLRVIYPILGERLLAPCPATDLAAFRQQRQVPEHYILYLGTLEPRKNLPRLIEAYARLRQMSRLPHLLLLAGGKGWYQQSLVECARGLHVEQHIRFLGYIAEEEKLFWYYGADLFVYPSLYEGFGLPVAEALACGIPVVTTHAASLPEVVGDDAAWGAQAALVVAPDDTEALAYAIQQGIENVTLRQQLQARGPARAWRFAPEPLIQQVVQVYEDAITG